MTWKDKSTISPGGVGEEPAVRSKNRISRFSTIAVAGAGVFGGWTALYLQRKGHKVSLYDTWGAGNSRSSSGGETRLMRCVYGNNRFYTRLALESYSLWEQLEQETGRKLLVPTGNLWFAGADDSALAMASPLMDELALPYEKLSPREAAARYPFVHTADLQYVFWEKKTGFLKARESCQVVLEQFVKEGGKYFPSQLLPGEMRTREMKHGQSADGTKVSADLYVFACGPWLKPLFPHLSALLRVTRQEVFYFGVPGQKGGYMEGLLPTFIDLAVSEGFYGIPGGVNRGFKVASDIRGREIDPTTENRVPDPAEIERARDYLAFRFPPLRNLPLLESRVCQYTNTPDGSFILDQHPEASNVWLLGGGSGHGFKHGPALGLLASDIIAGEKELPILLSVDRFAN